MQIYRLIKFASDQIFSRQPTTTRIGLSHASHKKVQNSNSQPSFHHFFPRWLLIFDFVIHFHCSRIAKQIRAHQECEECAKYLRDWQRKFGYKRWEICHKSHKTNSLFIKRFHFHRKSKSIWNLALLLPCSPSFLLFCSSAWNKAQLSRLWYLCPVPFLLNRPQTNRLVRRNWVSFEDI